MEARRQASSVLRAAPWIYQPRGSPRIREVSPLPSLVFPPGTSYQTALFQLYTSVVLQGKVPGETTLEPPLATGVVLLRPKDSGAGIAVDLRAPWGYDPQTGSILPPLFELPGTIAQMMILRS